MAFETSSRCTGRGAAERAAFVMRSIVSVSDAAGKRFRRNPSDAQLIPMHSLALATDRTYHGRTAPTSAPGARAPRRVHESEDRHPMSSGTLRNFIDGDYVEARGDTGQDLIDPATEEVYGVSPVATAADLDHAYRAASDAFETWGETTPAERQLALFRIADAMESRAEEFADLESQDTGKPRATLVADEIMQSVDQLRFFAGAARNLEGRLGGRVPRRPHVVRAPGADRRHRPGHAVELPAQHGGLEGRAGDRRRQHRGAQALGHDAPLDAPARRGGRRVPARRRAQRGHGRPRHGRGPPRAPDPADGRHHRVGARGDGGRPGGGIRPEARAPRARRQGARDRVRRCRPPGGGRGHRHRRLLQRGPGLHRRHPRRRARVGPRRVRLRPRCRDRRDAAHRRPAGGRRPLRPPQQREPARARLGFHRPAARARRHRGRRSAAGEPRLLLGGHRRHRAAAGRRGGAARDLRPRPHRAVVP